MSAIRDDLEGVVYVDVAGTRVTLSAGDEIPEGVVVGDHLRTADDDDDGLPGREGEPDRTGPKGTKAAWFAHATEDLGIAVPADAKRDAIVALVDAHHAALEHSQG